MTMKMWKETLEVNDNMKFLKLPRLAKVKHVGSQTNLGNEVDIWFEFDDKYEKDLEPRSFLIFGTGHPIPDGLVYRGTALTLDGRLVWHVYEQLQ